ncbi:DinB family protein [Paenibacillus sp. PR3]|uniref:DinB family protein n=1 Tax=Paenibacillus terricola TaxID=2763503 RepID=A0ABR8N1U2_9BACL|nr:DinB family protein [Paenibacillus terricola]MBD3922152.1 DinB family protein [Paenibacillus terricola]
MTVQQTIQYIDQELSDTLQQYQEWYELHPDILGFKPSEGWSIAQILEHVTLTNYYLLILIRKGRRRAMELASKVDMVQKLEGYVNNLGALDRIAQDKSLKWIRPEHMEPTGDKSLAEVQSLMAEQINECRQILAEIPNGEGILAETTMTVADLGKIDVYQYIYFLCQHARRHISQMERVREEYLEKEGTR